MLVRFAADALLLKKPVGDGRRDIDKPCGVYTGRSEQMRL